MGDARGAHGRYAGARRGPRAGAREPGGRSRWRRRAGRTRAPPGAASRGRGTGEPVAEVEEPKRGFWARLFGRKKPEPVGPRARAGARIEEPEPVAVEPEPEPERPFGTIEWEIPEPVAEEEPEPEPDTPADPAAVLHGMLDTLGAAHHRPFSRS